MAADVRTGQFARVSCAAVAALVLSALAYSTTPARAEVTQTDILRDSTLGLTERATAGSYQTLSVRLETRDGQATLFADKDGVKYEARLTTDEALALWRVVLAADIETLSDATHAGMPPDQSQFTISFRAGPAANSFRVYGVDSLTDTRCRDIVREILHVTDAHVFGTSWRK